MYVKTDSIKQEGKDVVSALVRLYPSKSLRKELRKKYLSAEKEVEREFGVKVSWTELALNKTYEEFTRTYHYKALCNNREIEVYNQSASKLLFYVEVKAGTPAEKVYDFLCKVSSSS